MDMTELKSACDAYQAAPSAAPIDWKNLLSLLPALIAIFVPGPLGAVITQIVQLVLNLLVPSAGMTFNMARADHKAGTGPSAALVTAMTASPGSQP